MITIYDSENASLDAEAASELVLRELGDEIDVNETWWDIRSFEDSELRSQAASEAAHSDLIVVALGLDSPTDGLRAWIDQWQKARELAGGLLALIPSGGAEGGDLADYLYETAVSANMDFLCRKQRRYQLG